MGTGSSRDHEVHVVVVQSQEGGQMDAKLIRGAYSKAMKKKGSKLEAPENEESQTNELEGSGRKKTPPSHLDIGIKEEDSGFNPHPGYQETTATSIYQRNGKQTELVAAGYERRSRSDSIETGRRSSSVSTEPGRRHRRQGMTGRIAPSILEAPSGLQNKSYHHLHNNHMTYSTATMETINDRDTPHTATQAELSPVSEKSVTGPSAGSMFELFHTFEGEEFTVYKRDDGKKFYVDFEEQKWRYFPDAWLDRGNFLPIDYDPYQGQSDHTVSGRPKQFTGVREGEFIHPTRGKLVTYLRQETTNVLYFFDEGSGSWFPMPLSWERHVPGVTSLISDVQRACPEWKDAKSIVGMLRCCKYSVEECVSVYKAINDDGILDYSETGLQGGRDPFRNLNEKKLKETTAQLKAMKEKHNEAKKQLEQLQSKVEELEAENERMKRELENGKMEHRRQSKMQRQLSLSQSFRGIKPSVIRPLLTILGEESRTLKAKVTTLRNIATKGLTSYAGSLHQLSTSVRQLVRIHLRQKQEIMEVRTLYQKEALQRRLLYNEVQELRGNIRVFCRCRYDNSDRCHLRFDNDNRVLCTTQQGRKKLFEFERVYPPETTQETVFEDTKPIITSCVDGYNVCILAYGQTGAGKTYTMMGQRDAFGVNIRSMKELFKICNERTKVKYTMKVSMVEVYNEAVYDLLASPEEGHQKLQLQHKGKNVIVPGLIEIEVRTMEDVMMIFSEGEKNRTVASTKMNTNSSRSHLLFFLKVEGFDVVSKATTRGRLTLVDLAGSERISRSEASGIRLVEAAAINKSLSALGQVFASIRTGALHIPYRNSKLTHLLQPSLGGDSKACMFVNVSPLEVNILETISTLEFGQNSRQVELGKATKHVTRPPGQ